MRNSQHWSAAESERLRNMLFMFVRWGISLRYCLWIHLRRGAFISILSTMFSVIPFDNVLAAFSLPFFIALYRGHPITVLETIYHPLYFRPLAAYKWRERYFHAAGIFTLLQHCYFMNRFGLNIRVLVRHTFIFMCLGIETFISGFFWLVNVLLLC